MTRIPHDDILEGLYKLRIRESEKIKTVLELCDVEIHQKKRGLDDHRLKAMVKRSIEQEIRNKRADFSPDDSGARESAASVENFEQHQAPPERRQRTSSTLARDSFDSSTIMERVGTSFFCASRQVKTRYTNFLKLALPT